MVGEGLLAAEAAPQYVAATAMVVLAGVLLYLNFGNRANRAFATFLVLRAAVMVLSAFGALADDPDASLYWRSVGHYFSIALFPAIVYFASVYPRPRGWFGRSRLGAATLWAAAAVAEILYALDHSLRVSYARTDAGVAVTGYGPLYVVSGLNDLAYGVLAFLFAREYVKAEPGPARRSLLAIGMAFTLSALYDGFGEMLGTSPNVPVVLDTWGMAKTALAQATLLPVLAAAWVLGAWGRTADAETRSTHRRILLVLPLPLVTHLVLFAAAPLGWGAGSSFERVAIGLWRLAVPALVTYALVRHQLFDIDLKIKRTLKQSTIGAMFITVYFIVSEAAQTLFQNKFGPFIGIVAAGLLVFVLHPLQRVADRVATAAMPHAKGIGELSHHERIDLYREQVRVAWIDGSLSKKERQMLEVARQRLGLRPDEAHALEHEVTQL